MKNIILVTLLCLSINSFGIEYYINNESTEISTSSSWGENNFTIFESSPYVLTWICKDASGVSTTVTIETEYGVYSDDGYGSTPFGYISELNGNLPSPVLKDILWVRLTFTNNITGESFVKEFSK